MSHERTITIEMGGKHYLLPTVIDGQALDPEAAVDLFRKGKNPPLGVFDSAEEADAAAIKRSRDSGLVNDAMRR